MKVGTRKEGENTVPTLAPYSFLSLAAQLHPVSRSGAILLYLNLSYRRSPKSPTQPEIQLLGSSAD